MNTKKNFKKKYFFFFLFFFFLKLTLYSETEIGLYSFEINKKIRTSGTKVHIINGNLYIELQNMLNILEITNNQWINERFTLDVGNIYGQEKYIDFEKKYIKKGNNKISFIDEIIEKEEKIYVDIDFLHNLIGISEIDKDEDRLMIKIKTLFTIPAELNNIRKYKKEEFLKGDNGSKKNIYTEKKILAPGNLRLIYDYGKTYKPSRNEYKYLEAEYLGPMLYGDLEIYYGIYPDLKNYQTRLTYRDVYKNHDLIFGDVAVNMPRSLRGTVGGIRGISFTKDYRVITEYDENMITISGYAPMGKFVELYKNGQLLSYEDVVNGQYKFENIPSLFGSDYFQIIIYNLDGSIKKETLNRYSGNRLERKGDFGYNFHAGESSYGRYNQFIGEIDYGLTDTTTIKTGFYDLEYDAHYTNNNPQKNQSIKLGVLHTSQFMENPYTIEIETVRNNKGESDFYYDLSHNIGDYMFTAEGGKYSNTTAKRINKKQEVALSASKSKFIFNDLSVGLKYFSADYLYGTKDREIGAVFRTRFRSFIPEYAIYKNTEKDSISHDFSVRSYYFRNYTLYAGVYHRKIRDFDDTRYRFEITSKRYRENGIRYRAYYEKSERYGDIYGLSFDIDYDYWFSGGASFIRSNGKSTISNGFTIDKVINLSDVKSKTTSVENGNIHGKVYVDNNYNGQYDEGIDKVLPRTQVMASRVAVSSDEKGEYKISNLYPGKHDVNIEAQNPLYVAQYDTYKARVNQADTLKLDIPLYPRKLVSGMITFNDETLRYKYLKTLYLNVIDIKNNKKIEVCIPENDGYFIIENLILGKYKLVLESVDNQGIALAEKEIEITKETSEMEIELKIAERKSESQGERKDETKIEENSIQNSQLVYDFIILARN